MTVPFATMDDLATRLGTTFTDPVEIAQVDAFLVDVSELIRSEVPSIDQSIVDGTVTAEMARAVACQVAARVLTTAGNGGVYGSETHPEYAYTLTAAAAAGLDLTDAEKRRLTPRAKQSRAFSITPG